MYRKIVFEDDSTVTISISMVEEGKMATIAYNTLVDFIDDELLEHPELSLQADQNLGESAKDELSLDDFEEDEFEDDDAAELDDDWDEEEDEEDEVEGYDWIEEDDDDDKVY